MSTASKVTFGASCASAVFAFYFINWSQAQERGALRQGPIKDAARVKAKHDRELSLKQLANELEHREQKELREKYILLQPLNSEIITGDAADDE